MNILITGASGLLGLNLALEASGDSYHRQHSVYGVVNNQMIHTEAFTVIPCNLLAPGAVERLIDQVQPDWVIHCAALANLDACEADPALASELNTELPRKLAAHVSKGGARLVHISTDAVFNGVRGNYTEDDDPNPLGIYSQTKLAGERAVAETDPSAIIARVNLYGWSVSGKRSLAEFFVNNLTSGRQVNGFTDVYFCPLLANDLADLLIGMLAKGLSGLYHVVSSECLSKYEFGLKIAQRFQLDGDLIKPSFVQQSGLKAARAPNLTLSTDKLVRDLGVVPPGIDSGIDKFFNLYESGYVNKIKEVTWKSK